MRDTDTLGTDVLDQSWGLLRVSCIWSFRLIHVSELSSFYSSFMLGAAVAFFQPRSTWDRIVRQFYIMDRFSI